LQRLPVRSIERANVIGKVRFKEHPALAHLGGRNTALFGAAAQFFGVQLEKHGSLCKIECFHIRSPMMGLTELWP